MSNKITLRGKFPSDEQNGMTLLEDHWSQVPKPEPVYALVQIERNGNDIDSDVVKAQITQVELVAPADVEAVKKQMRAYCDARGGFMASAPDLQLDLPEDAA